MPRNIDTEDEIILFFIKLFRAFVRVLPARVSIALGSTVGFVAYKVSKRKDIAYRNLRAAFCREKSRAEMKKIARSSVQNIGRLGVELLRIPDMDKKYIEEHIEIKGEEEFKRAYQDGKGVIFLTGHFGNWEMLNITGAILDYPVVALARIQKHPKSDEYLNSLRASKGSRVVYKGILIREILKALKKGEVVGIVSDQDGGKNGSFVNFFGRVSSSPSGAATFALRTGAPIFPIFTIGKGAGKHTILLKSALKIPAAELPEEEKERFIMQQFADLLEAQIRLKPEQWLWAHRRWKSTPDRFVLILSDGKTGHVNQSLAVLEAYKEERKSAEWGDEHIHTQVVEARYKNKLTENLARLLTAIFRGHLPFKPFLLKSFLHKTSYEKIMATYADVVISCGSSLVPINILAKHENAAKSIVVMKPFCGTGVFDAVIAPRHDKIKKNKNIFVTDRALTLISEKVLLEESQKLSGDLKEHGTGQKRIGFLVGGDTESFQFDRVLFGGILKEISRFLTEKNAHLLTTSSRRTPAWAEAELKTLFGKNQNCPLLVIANEANRQGAVPGILGLCDTVVVSGESMSMVSEAVSSGKKVIVFSPSSNFRMKRKHKDFLSRLEEGGLLMQADAGSIFKCLDESLAQGARLSDKLIGDKEVLRQAVKSVA